MNSEQFSHGYYIAPVQNVCAMFTRMWSEISLGLISDFKTSVYDIKSYQELVFTLVYYKACISYQVVHNTVTDYKEYKPIYDDMVRYAKIDKFYYPKFISLHDRTAVKLLSRSEKQIRTLTVQLAKYITTFGIPIIIPFQMEIYWGLISDAYQVRAFNYSMSKEIWPEDRFHAEILKYTPGSNVFKMLPIDSIRGQTSGLGNI